MEKYLDFNPEDLKNEIIDSKTLVAYVDGSFNPALAKYAFGCVFIFPDGRLFIEFGNGDNEESLKQRNVSGEMLGAMFATKFAIKNGFSCIYIKYDYEGIEKWYSGEWKAKNDHTQKYRDNMREWSKSIDIKFAKITAHSKDFFNDLADSTAKRGLEEGAGIPPIEKVGD